QSQLSVAQQQSSLNSLLAPVTEIELEQAQLSVESAQASLYSASSSGTTSESDVEIAHLQAELAANSLWQAQMNRDEQLEQAAARTGGEVSYSTELQANSSVNSAERSLTISELQYEDTADGDSGSYSQIASGQATLASAEADLADLQAGATEASMRLAEINLEQAQLNLESAERSLADYALVAPFSGLIAEQSLTVGMLPSTGSITLIDTSTFTLDVSIAEADVASVALGQKVTLSVQALPDAELTGTITHIDLIPGASTSGLVTYGATITLDPAPEVALRPGMSATASIILEQLDDVLLLPTRFLRTNEQTGATTVMVRAADGTITEVTVTVGARGASETEIASGLIAGQTVVLVVDTSIAEDAAAGGLGFGLMGGAGGGQMRMEGGVPPSGAMPPGGPPGAGG
ncbi:MAG TPA: efflux RND transporter periplasmic adaptor subunit, partial [Candidatus Limnocylindrales bacterium]|nr:efflux RND transporter periplasmic adaptor subunit [Candidatus Limnocylindrales bacterium]